MGSVVVFPKTKHLTAISDCDIGQFSCLAGEDAGYIIRIITSGKRWKQ